MAVHCGMNIEKIRLKLASAHVPSVAILTGVSKRTIYRFRAAPAGFNVPAFANLIRLDRWMQTHAPKGKK